MSGFARLAALTDVPIQSSLVVDHDGQKVLLVRLDDGVRAYNGRCPHAGTVLAAGQLVDGELIECPMHGAYFRASDGTLEPGPVSCADLTAWPAVVVDGHITVDVPAKPASLPPTGRPLAWTAPATASLRTTER